MKRNFWKKALAEWLPPILFHRLRNCYRKRLRASGHHNEVYVSGWPRAHRVNGHRRVALRDNGTDQITFDQVFRYQEYNLGHLPRGKDILEWYRRMDSPVIIDCGANIGASTVFLAEAFPKATIVCVEPDSGNHEQLLKNTQGYPNVIPVKAAVCADDGWIRIVNPADEPNSFRTERCEGGEDAIQAVSIATLLEKAQGQPFFLKVDIEGGEADLFGKHHVLLHRFPVVAVEIHDWMLPGQGTSRNFLEWHLQEDRDLLIHHEMLYSVVKQFG
jgi:FkbM family methyltransferase